jgi:ATP:corrinoid adenosyltransferase
MPLYRFNLEDHRFIADRGTHDCIDQAHAEEIADEIAERLVQSQPELIEDDHAIVVRDETNREIYRAGLDRESVLKRRH